MSLDIRKGLLELGNLAGTVVPFERNDHRAMQFEVYKDGEFILKGWYFPYKPEDQRNFHKFTLPLIQQGYEITQWKEPWKKKPMVQDSTNVRSDNEFRS